MDIKLDKHREDIDKINFGNREKLIKQKVIKIIWKLTK